MAKRIYLLLLIVFNISASVTWAQVSLDTIIARLSTQVGLYPQEKVYLHLDHWQCARGERINYRAYCVNAITHEPMDTSRFVYVELIDTTGQVLVRNKNVNDYGCATGFLIVPKGAPSGICYIRAYTRRSAELDARFVSVTPVMISSIPNEGRRLSTSNSKVPRVIVGEQQGMTLSYVDSTLNILIEKNVGKDGLYLVLLNRMIPFYYNKVTSGECLCLDVEKLPSGIGHAILVNEDYDIVAEASFASTDETIEYSCPVTVKEEPRGHHRLIDVFLPSLMTGEEAQLSIGVVRKQTFNEHHDIGFDLGLCSEVPMGIGWNTKETLSRLSPWMTIRDGRYDLQRALHRDYMLPVADIEVTTTICGTTKSLLLNRPIKNATVCGISPWSGIISSTVSNDKGEFVLGGLDAMGDNTDFVVQAIQENGSKDIYLNLKTPNFPPSGMSRIEHEPYWHIDSLTGDSTVVMLAEVTDDDILTFDYEGTILLPNLEVRGFRIGHQGGKVSDFSTFSDYTITSDYIEHMRTSDIENLIRMIPGAFYRLPFDGQGKPRLYFRTPTSLYDDQPVAFAIDGCLGYDIDPQTIQIEDIERIDVFKTGAKALWGRNGGGGVISIKLKDMTRVTDVNNPNVKTISVSGFQRPESIKIDENGKTLYWNPDVVMVGDDNYETFYRFDLVIPQSGVYDVVIEGITSSGRTIHACIPIK